jgi:hypothetical protein
LKIDNQQQQDNRKRSFRDGILISESMAHSFHIISLALETKGILATGCRHQRRRDIL